MTARPGRTRRRAAVALVAGVTVLLIVDPARHAATPLAPVAAPAVRPLATSAAGLTATGRSWFHATPPRPAVTAPTAGGAAVLSRPPIAWGAVPADAGPPVAHQPWTGRIGNGGAPPGPAAARRFTSASNWAGVVLDNAAFSHVGATWSVPSVTAAAGPEQDSATWVGIDGFDNQDLIQTGTAQNATAQGPQYFAWYEILPAPATILGPVSPGDVMTATIDEVGPNSWNLSLQDATSTNGAAGTLTYTGPANSAEWIEEAPSDSQGNIQPLADFGSVRFTDPGAQGSGSPNTLAVEMTNATGQIIAYPTNYTSTSFDVLFGSPSSTTTTTGPSTTAPSTTTTLTGSTTAPPTTATTQPPVTTTTTPASTPPPFGYWLVAGDGGIFSFGAHPFLGSTGGIQLSAPVVAMAATPDRQGYYLLGADGGLFTFGDAPFHGSAVGRLGAPAVAMAVTPDGGGYWITDATGRVLAFGNASNLGSAPPALALPIVGMAPTVDGGGYWLVARDGGIFSFGDAGFYGSTGALRLSAPVVGMAATYDGRGYWLVGADGGIFTFGDAGFYGSTGALRLNRPVVGMARTPTGLGYWLVGADGGIFTFGDAAYYGSTGGTALSRPVLGMAS